MTTSRRLFLKLSTLAGTGLALGVTVATRSDEPQPFAPNLWVRIGTDGTIALTVGKCEMGQGVRTSLPMILAEELDADWDRVKIVQGEPGGGMRGLGTGGSYSLRALWTPLRTAGAAAREMLVAAAAARFAVDATTLRTEKGFVVHDATSRRLAYGDLSAAAATLPVPTAPKLKEAKDFRIVGKATKRVDNKAIVTGTATYGFDVRLPGMLYASIERPPVIGGTVKSFDATAAKKVPGVVSVAQVSRGVAVLARDSWSALKGREALRIEFEDGGFGKWSSEEYAATLVEASKQPGIATRREGDSASITERAVKTVEADYVYPFYAHAPLETMNTTAWMHDGICEIWSSTQAPHDVHERTAELLGMTPDKVRVHLTLVGGGFGRRLGWDYALDAAEVAKTTDKPVQVFWTRQDDMRHGYFQAPSLHRMRAVVDKDGIPLSWSHKKVSTYHNARRKVTPAQMQDPEYNRGSSWGAYDVPYGIGVIDTSYVYVPTHIPIGPWRAVFAPSSVFARETFFDEVAAASGRDPLQLRLDLLNVEPELAEIGSLKVSRSRLRRVLETVRDKAKWGQALPKGRGRGIACNVYDGVTHIAYAVDVTVDAKRGVRVDKVVCAIDCGLVVNPTGVEQQVEGGIIWGLSSALKGEITIRNGIVEQSSFDDFEVLRLDETPRMETHILPSDRPMPFGVGEPPVAPIVPALVNAIHAATGKRLRKLPIRPGDLA